jgi:hypothetical protein
MLPPQPPANLPPLPPLNNDGNEEIEAGTDDVEVAAPLNDLGTSNLNDSNESDALDMVRILLEASEATAV